MDSQCASLLTTWQMSNEVYHKLQGLLTHCSWSVDTGGVSVILSSQKLKLPLISPTVRVNITFALIFRLRNNSDLIDGFESEYSSIVDKRTLHAMYTAAVSKPFGFLYLNLMEQDRNKIFHNGFQSRFIIDEQNEPEDAWIIRICAFVMHGWFL